MSLDPQLQRWVEAGLISVEQAQRIHAFEQHDERPTLLYAVAGLGGLAIAVGLISIVASNWDDIPGRVKLGLDLVLVAGLGAGIWRLEQRGPSWARETAIVALHGLVLASIALVGQVYQRGGEANEALAIWTVLTAMLMTRARSGLAAAVWLVGLQITWAVWAVWLAERWHADELAAATVYWAPLVCLALAHVPAIRRLRPALADTLEAIGWMELVLCATIGAFTLYADTSDGRWHETLPAAGISAMLTVALALTLRIATSQRLLLAVCLVLSHVPLLGLPGDLAVAAALAFVALWIVVAWAAHDARDARLLNLATAMIGLRIVAIYFEVFGTLLDTGLGLISGGLLTLGVVWLWAHKRKQFEQELGGGGRA
ncbi:MAG: DUF2157 domain-containing protein [Deltaproteobacteria bacterium]|nr:DUF2157 domain-containing protein [Nannocystaceae bacterium]